MYSWNRGDRYLQTVTDDICREMAIDPGWDCPNMKIVDGKIGKIADRVLGRSSELDSRGSDHRRYWPPFVASVDLNRLPAASLGLGW
jgi:hypothetical protein